ncbi:MAG TPA: 1,4-dihydroxy-2-naphthoyl-CoA synthase [Desulfobacteraceae bacterium]|nr:MAG: 1,4-dihydroxy-2-naphthoyl-CoA synthase [Desulfobacteraceae bacterium 4484_190.3]HDH88327.1 1,4-dihydroxy-2-naphthoyl-CoA synthase [Desulfobacteraceae bacterium]
MEYQDILFSKGNRIARIIINRPEKLNAFRAQTLKEMASAFEDIEKDPTIGVVVLRGQGNRAFCVGGDSGETGDKGGYSAELLLYATKVHDLIRKIPVPVIAAVNGYAIGGGHVIHVVCDLSIASETAIFGQAGPRVGSFDSGFGANYLARVVGEKKAREIWFLCEQYSAQEALEMGLVNKVVPPSKLDEEVNKWCEKILNLSPTALKILKQSFNLDTDHINGVEALSMSNLWLFFNTEEAKEGRRAFLEKRQPDFSQFRK